MLANHKLFMSSMNIPFNWEYDDFSSLYWIPKLHKNPLATWFPCRRGRTLFILGSI